MRRFLLPYLLFIAVSALAWGTVQAPTDAMGNAQSLLRGPYLVINNFLDH
jgi:hypothetical protein